MSFQGENTYVFTLKSKTGAFIKKLSIWKLKVENDFFEMFAFTEDFLADNDVESNIIIPHFVDHLSNLLKQFKKYFRSELDNTKLDWIQNLFAVLPQSTKHLRVVSRAVLFGLGSGLKLIKFWAQFGAET